MIKMTSSNFVANKMTASNCIVLALAAAVCCFAAAVEAFPQNQNQNQNQNQYNWLQGNSRQRAVFARRAADDSRPLLSRAASQQDELVVGKFRAPAPEQIHQQRVPKKSQFGAQTMTASFRVSDVGESSPIEKIVHGVHGASASQPKQQQQQQQFRQQTVGAKIQVSDEGLNYPPSKLSADIYGNVAEIVTAPPEAVENDFLIPTSSRQPQQKPPKARRSYNN